MKNIINEFFKILLWIIQLLKVFIQSLFITIGKNTLKVGFIAIPAKKILMKFPRLYKMLFKMIKGSDAHFIINYMAYKNNTYKYEDLSRHAKQIYNNLKKAIIDFNKQKNETRGAL